MSTTYTPTERTRNYRLLVAEGILFTVGLVFFDPNTVLPLLMERLTGSAVLVGIVGAVQPFAKGFVPILAGNWILSLAYKKRYLIAAVSISRLPLSLLALGLLWAPWASPAIWAALLLLVQLLFWIGDSGGDPAWMDMVGKSVRFDRRGRFFATRQVIGGLLSVGAGAVVAAILEADRFAFPTNYGVVIAIAAAIYLANVATVVGLVERPSKTSERLDVPTLIRRLPHYLRANPAFARTMLVLVLFNMARLSMPFYIVYGRQTLGLAAAAVGIVIAAQMAGRVAGAMLWGYLGDRHGHERAVRGGTIAAAVPALLALGFAALPVGPVITVAYALLFFVLGMSLEGWPPFINYMLAIVPEDERPMYAGLMGVGYVPAAVAPIVGGVLVSLWDYSGVFLVTAVLTGAGAAASLWLRSEAQPLAGATERPDSRNDAG